MTAGSVFLMWLGEQIDKLRHRQRRLADHDRGHPLPHARRHQLGHLPTMTPAGPRRRQQARFRRLLMLVGGFVLAIRAGAILITVAQRRIPIQQAKHTRGRKVFGGQKHYLPLRINHAGVMPIIFASSLMIFPSAFFGFLQTRALTDNWGEVMIVDHVVPRRPASRSRGLPVRDALDRPGLLLQLLLDHRPVQPRGHVQAAPRPRLVHPRTSTPARARPNTSRP